ncbi:MAG: sensor histidine kinase [Propionibacteriales bacterium]|nr:sensor histidine kinase [Propionibacteriales bacterium]
MGIEMIELATRWPLYLLSASEPVVVPLVVLSEPGLRASAVVVLLAATIMHTVTCVALLHAGFDHFLGGLRPGGWLVGSAVGLTVAALLGVFAVFRTGTATPSSLQDSVPAGALALVFCGALTCAAAPLLPARRLVVAVAVPAVLAGVLQRVADAPGQPLWAVNYFLTVGGLAVSYRFSLWLLGVAWAMNRARDVQARLAVAEERLRFARDLHDVLGRNLALIAVNSDLAASLVRRGQVGAVERMLEVRQTAEDSMREVRDVVAGHRTADLASELAGARSVLRSAGITARVIGDGAVLPESSQAALGWVVREATTNIIRHSDPTTVTIDLEVRAAPESGPVAVLRIQNDGAQAAGTSYRVGGGTGLTGLRERLVALGGGLSTGTTPDGGFVVRAWLPLGAAAPTPPGRVEPAQ